MKSASAAVIDVDPATLRRSEGVDQDHPDVTLPAGAERRLDALEAPSLDPAATFAIKRNEHRFVTDVPPGALVRALAAVLEDPTARFGPIRVIRARRRVGRPFAPGERFLGAFGIETLAAGWLERRGLPTLARVVRGALRTPLLQRALRGVEREMLSDRAILTDLVLDPPAGEPHRLRYRYLDGLPFRGESTYVIEPTPDGGSSVRQTFLFQETGAIGLTALHRFGIRAHDRAVLAQVEAAARRSGGRVIEHTVR